MYTIMSGLTYRSVLLYCYRQIIEASTLSLWHHLTSLLLIMVKLALHVPTSYSGGCNNSCVGSQRPLWAINVTCSKFMSSY